MENQQFKLGKALDNYNLGQISLYAFMQSKLDAAVNSYNEKPAAKNVLALAIQECYALLDSYNDNSDVVMSKEDYDLHSELIAWYIPSSEKVIPIRSTRAIPGVSNKWVIRIMLVLIVCLFLWNMV